MTSVGCRSGFKVITTVSGARRLKKELTPGIVGLVPTMGALHAGHEALIEKARQDCDSVIVSVFINPLQFGQAEDFGAYPRDLEADIRAAMKAGGDAVFAPSRDEFIGGTMLTSVNVDELDKGLCGRSRPGHFKGVATIVAKLFNMLGPDKAYFGEKDWQQLQIVRRMVDDLDIDVDIVSVPTVRDSDGLAISSRNRYLSADERKAATILPKALDAMRAMVAGGETRATVLSERFEEMIATEPDVELEYFSVCRPQSLKAVDKITGDVLMAASVHVGGTRLIDNMVINA